MVKNPPANAGDIKDATSILGLRRPSAEGIATHSSVLDLRIPWAEEPGGLWSIEMNTTKDTQHTQTRTHTLDSCALKMNVYFFSENISFFLLFKLGKENVTE